MTKIICLFLSLMFCLCSLSIASCAPIDNGPSESSPALSSPESSPEATPESSPEATPESSTESAPESVPESSTESLPESVPEIESESVSDIPETTHANEINIISPWNSYTANEITVEVSSGNPISAVALTRNLIIEEMFDCTILNHLTTGSDYMVANEIYNSFGPDCRYDISALPAYTAFDKTANGHWLDLREVTSIDLEQGYWVPSFNSHARIGGRQYFATGDISLSLHRLTAVTFVNPDKLNGTGIDELYTAVYDGQWTIDKQLEIVNDSFKELDGIEGTTEGDFYGLLTNNYFAIDAYWSSCNTEILTKDADDFFVLSNSIEHLDETFLKVKEIYFSNGTYSYARTGNDSQLTAIREKFAEGNAAMATMHLYSAEFSDIREMADFAILPIPKLDTNQKEYYSFAEDAFTVYGIISTKSADEAEFAGRILEEFALGSSETVTPYHIKLVLKGELTQPKTEEEKLLGMILSNVKIDGAFLYTMLNGNLTQVLRNAVKSDSPLLSTTVFTGLSKKNLHRFLDRMQMEIRNIQE